MDALEVFLLAAIFHIGKSCSHATRSKEWARVEHIEGLPISDWYHMFSGLSLLAVTWACARTWGDDVPLWICALLLWGTLWPLSKLLKGLTLREAIKEAWYTQLVALFRSRTLPWIAGHLTN